MPSPIGHVLGGAIVYLGGTRPSTRSRLLLAVALLGSLAPDLDFVPGILIGNMRAFHHGISHSVAFALVFGGLTYGLARYVDRTIALRASVLGALAYTSHVVLDFIAVSEGTRGLPLLWPFSDERFGVNLGLFGHFRYTDIRDGIWSVVRSENASPLVRELLILGTALVLLHRREQLGQWRIAPLLVWGFWLVVLTLYPFEFAPPAPWTLLLDDANLLRRGPDVILNVLLFVPLGIWAHGEGWRRAVPLARIVVFTAAAGAVISSVLECLQLFLPSRFPSLLDVASNTAGAVVGLAAHRRWAPSAEAGVRRLRARVSPAMVLLLMGGYGMAALLGSAMLQTQTRLSNWDETYPLLIGNEPTGDRPWRGRVFGLELTDAATPVAALRRFAEDGSRELAGARVAEFDFSNGGPYVDASGYLPALGWTGHSHREATHGAAVSGRKWLQTDGPASTLVRRLRETNAFTLYVRCATEDVDQRGPARVVSNSVDPFRRNFTLGQSGRSMGVRVRTPHTGENALRPELVVPNVFTDERPRDILVTYDGAVLQAAVAGLPRVFRFELGPGSALAAMTVSYFTSVDLGMYALVYLVVLFVPPAVFIAVLGETRRERLYWSAAWIAPFAVLLEAALALTIGRSFEWSEPLRTAAVGAVVCLGAIAIPSGPVHRISHGWTAGHVEYRAR
jgi:VanZ family protein